AATPAIVPAPNEPDSTVAATSIDFKDFLDAASPVVFCLFFPANVPAPFRGNAIALITAGLMSLAFMGFSGLVKL
ncbi:hypothetical protein MJI95_38075, partial [Salmonella enterica subsp. enterica serovar Kentucky]|nr:hypothetical protein [Salmonella enterica subsp. enterica serovar Kentucky]